MASRRTPRAAAHPEVNAGVKQSRTTFTVLSFLTGCIWFELRAYRLAMLLTSWKVLSVATVESNFKKRTRAFWRSYLESLLRSLEPSTEACGDFKDLKEVTVDIVGPGIITPIRLMT